MFKKVFTGIAIISLSFVNISLADTLAFHDAKDSYLSLDQYAHLSNENFGDEVTLHLTKNIQWWEDGLIEFEGILGENSDQLSLDAIVESATLTFTYAYLNTSSGASNILSLYEISQDWEEDTVTAVSFGGRVSDPARSRGLIDQIVGPLSATATAYPYKIEFDVTSSILNWMNGDENYGWGITVNGYSQEIFSSEAENEAYRPVLTINYSVNAVPEPTTMFLFGTGIAGLLGARLRRKK